MTSDPVRPPDQPWRAHRLHLAVLASAALGMQLAGYLAGVRYDDAPFDDTFSTDIWQLLDIHLLQHHLVQSIWYLQSQPPLFNLYAGLLLKLPDGFRRPTEVLVSLVLVVSLVTLTSQVMVALRVPRRAAFVVTLVGVALSPDLVLYASWLNYGLATATLLMAALWWSIRFLATRRTRTGVAWFAALSAVTLLNTTYQVEWLLGIVIFALVLSPRTRRHVLVVACVPVLVVACWMTKNAVLFGTTSTSSWLGMNLARPVLFHAPPAEIRRLERNGTLTALASVTPFSGPDRYVPRFVQATPSAVPALGELSKSDGWPNYNNPLYIQVANQYLRDDLAFIAADPGRYARDVAVATQAWSVPTDQYFTGDANSDHLAPYAHLYDRWVGWQVDDDPAPVAVLYAPNTTSLPWTWLSFQAVIVTLLVLVGTPLLLWRRRRSGDPRTLPLVMAWWTCGFALAVSSCFELGENERFRFELGPLPLVLATVVATELVRSWRVRRRAQVTS